MHTPGPWRVADDGTVMFTPTGEWRHAKPVPLASGFREEAFCGGDGTSESRANAYLAAAAPDLLDACKALLKSHRQGAGQCCEAADLGIAAIAKALSHEAENSPQQTRRPHADCHPNLAGNSEVEPDGRDEKRSGRTDQKGGSERQVGGRNALLPSGLQRGERDVCREVGSKDLNNAAGVSEARAAIVQAQSGEVK